MKICDSEFDECFNNQINIYLKLLVFENKGFILAVSLLE